MARPVVGKAYLFVICKGCQKNFRVLDDPLFEGKEPKFSGPQRLRCRGCGFEAQYAPADMQAKYFLKKQAPTGA
jgi:hypothetical protein